MVMAGAPGYARETPKPVMAWSARIPHISSLSISPDGRFVGIVSNGGKVMCYSISGSQIWSTDLPGATDVIISPGAEYALAFCRLNSCETTVTFFDSEGRTHWSRKITGAIWSADACKTKDGARFVVGTGEKYVYVFDIGKNRRDYRRWRAPGVVVTISLDASGENVTFGTWQDSAIVRSTARGRQIWKTQADGRALQHVQTLPQSDCVLLRSIPNRVRAVGEFALLDCKGKRIWSGNIRPSYKDRVLVSPGGEYVCVGYTKAISHKGAVEKEEHAVLYDSGGHELWDKGSLFFTARPLLVTKGGMVLVAGAGNSLFRLGRSGEPEPSLKLPAAIVRSISSRDGKRLLVECANERLYLINMPSG